MAMTTAPAPKLTKCGYAALIRKAEAAAHQAGLDAVPTPMVVQQHSNVLNDTSPVVKEWYVGEGACGFGWVVIRPATSGLVRYLREHGIGNKNYYGGWQVWSRAVDHRGYQTQSITRNYAWAQAYARVLKDAGFEAHASSRMD